MYLWSVRVGAWRCGAPVPGRVRSVAARVQSQFRELRRLAKRVTVRRLRPILEENIRTRTDFTRPPTQHNTFKVKVVDPEGVAAGQPTAVTRHCPRYYFSIKVRDCQSWWPLSRLSITHF